MTFLIIETKIPFNFSNVPIETLILKKSIVGNMIESTAKTRKPAS
jgi:1-deoxy-D-xylulose 5-phosphate reductoisomerase